MLPSIFQWFVGKYVAVCTVVGILAVHLPTSTLAGDHSVTECIAQWNFGSNEDLHNDRWPDGWVRRKGAQFPAFIPIQITKRSTTESELEEIDRLRRAATQIYLGIHQNKWPWEVIPESIPPAIDRWLERSVLNPYLSFKMDGGAAEVSSPVIPIDKQSVYGFDMAVQSQPCDFEVVGALIFLDVNKQPVFETTTPAVNGQNEWKVVGTQMTYGDASKVEYVQVAIRIIPKTVKAFRGEFGIDSVRILRMPKIKLAVDKPTKIYRQGESIRVQCTASGMKNDHTEIEIHAFDHNGNKVASISKSFNRVDSIASPVRPDAASPASSKPSSGSSLSANTVPPSKGSSSAARPLPRPSNNPFGERLIRKNLTSATQYWEGGCEWSIPGLPSGYYELRTKLAQGHSTVFELNEQFIVLPKNQSATLDTRFGWTLNTTAHQINMDALIDIVREGRAGRVKVPIWYDARDTKAQDTYTRLVDRLQTAGVSCVGVIGAPPESLREHFRSKRFNDASSILEDKSIWQSFLDPVIRQMCVRLIDFQVGWDDETEFAMNPRFSDSIESLRRLLKLYGPETQLTASRSPWVEVANVKSIDNWQLTSEIEIAASEMQNLQPKANESLGVGKCWTSITPIAADKYGLTTRAQDLAARMIECVKPTSTSSTAWVSRPFDDDVGMLSPDGGPREMFLPYRSMADALSGMTYFGKMELSAGCANSLVGNESKVRLILWSQTPCTEQLFLGDKVVAYDVWGTKVPVDTIQTEFGPEQRIVVGPWPTIVDGIDPQVARWRMGISIANHRLDSILGQTQKVLVRFSNPFPNPISGKIQLHSPELFVDQEESGVFDIDANSTADVAVPVLLRPDASTQDTPVKIIVTVQFPTSTRFFVEKFLPVGTDEFDVDVNYRTDQSNQLIVDVEITNNGEKPVDFDCMLLMPDRPRERLQIIHIKERALRVLVLPNADTLVGKTLWLRCEQIGADRVINRRITVDANLQSENDTAP